MYRARHEACRLCQHRRMRQLLVQLSVCLGLGSGLAQAAPPQRNLSVEMRVSEDLADAQRQAQGAVRIDSRGQASGAVVLRAGTSMQTSDSAQRVLVLNGGRATLRLAQGLPLNDVEVVWTPWGPGAALRTQWVELVNGMEVRPLWPGGDAPVTLEIAVQSAGRAAVPNFGQALSPQTSLLTTVQVPFGEWVEVARLQGRQSTVSSGGGFGAATTSRERSLQIRVSLP